VPAVAHPSSGPTARASTNPSALARGATATSEVPALALDAFRAALGVLLALHYGSHARWTPAVLELWWPPPSGAQTIFEAWARALPRMGIEGTRIWFGFGALGGSFVALGVAPRACAALLLAISATSLAALGPAATLDDALASLLAFWIALSPVGATLTVARLRDWRTWADRRVGPGFLWGGLTFGAVLLTEISFWSRGSPLVARLGVFGAAAWLLATSGGVRGATVILAASAFGTLCGSPGTTLACGAALAWCGLGLGLGTMRRRSRNANDRAAPSFGLAAALGACVATLLVLHGLALSLGARALAGSTRAVLAALGVPASAPPLVKEPRTPPVDLGFAPTGDDRIVPAGLDPRNRRLQSLLRLLDDPASQTKPARWVLVRNLVAGRCLDREREGPSFLEDLVLLQAGRATRRIVSFECGAPGTETRLVPIDEGGLVAPGDIESTRARGDE
jgi:hypothetical protein